MYEFACESGHLTERYVPFEQNIVQCNCGASAKRIISAPAISLEGWSGSFPSAYGQFEQRHLDKLKAEQKANS